MMSITETTVVAGILTFLLYCVFPLGVILYLTGTPRRRLRNEAEKQSVKPAEKQEPEKPADKPAAEKSETENSVVPK